VFSSVLAVLLQLLLHSHQRVAGLAALQPWQSATDPFQKLKKEKSRFYISFVYVTIKFRVQIATELNVISFGFCWH
jgi:hypothetical protein